MFDFVLFYRRCLDLEHELKNLHHQLKSYLARIDDVGEFLKINLFLFVNHRI